MLLRKGLLLVPITILGITIFSNTVNANSMIDTKERIKEIKIVEEQNIDRLIRRKDAKIASITSYTRSNMVTTSRYEVERTKVEKKEKITTTKIESKTPKKQTVAKKENQKTTKKRNKKESNTNKKIEQKETKLGINNIRISKNMDLTKRTGLSKEQFKKVMKNLKQDTSKFFYNNADTIYDVCAKYQINEIFFCGLISAESGWNIAGNHRRTHNYISLMSKGKLIKYSSTKQGLEVAAQKLHNNYLTPGGKFYGGKTLYGVKKKFCPSGTWVDLVYGRMTQVMNAVKKIK